MFAALVIPLVMVFSLAPLAIEVFLLAYLGHASLVIIEQTAAGNDEVTWPHEAWPDWMWRGLYPLRLLVVWLAIIAIPIAAFGGWAVLENPYVNCVVAIAFLWLVFPLSLLSSLSANSPFVLLSGVVLARLFRLPRQLLAFYAASGGLAFGVLLLFLFGLFGWRELVPTASTVGPGWMPAAVAVWAWVFVTPVAAVCGATALMLYARLLGRLAWMMNIGQPAQKRRTAPKNLPIATTSRPSTSMPEAEPVPGAEVFALAPQGPAETVSADESLDATDEDDDDEEESSEDAMPATAPPLLTKEVWHFPWYRSSLKTWTWFCFNVLILLGVILTVAAFFP